MDIILVPTWWISQLKKVLKINRRRKCSESWGPERIRLVYSEGTLPKAFFSPLFVCGGVSINGTKRLP